MKNLIVKPLLLLTIVLIGFVGCSSDKGGSSSGRSRGTQPISNNKNSGSSSFQMDVGVIYGSDSNTFTATIKSLLSASMDESDVGNVAATLQDQASSRTGITFYGAIAVRSDGYLDYYNSALQIAIYDDQTITEGLDPIQINFNQLSSAYVDSSNAKLEFADEYGSIIFEGTYDTNYYQGTIRFINKINYSTADVLNSGTLGHFRVKTCGFFRCDTAPH